MRQVPGFSLWLGNVGDVRDVRTVLATGVIAIVDLAMNEPPAPVARDLVYCRFPLVDGAGNPDWLVRAAIETVRGLLASEIPTLVYCGAGMSRSPCIAAAAVALEEQCSPAEALELVSQPQPLDVSPALWRHVQAVLAESRRR